ncbi:histone H1.03-like [Uloborus diversus]|uniref:histone H1.03-like n=1 Tax=Uloborus diversus TaxID=327109 RepID=UPI002409B861|nr:histone H1.03-like [Uloborus diversus]
MERSVQRKSIKAGKPKKTIGGSKTKRKAQSPKKTGVKKIKIMKTAKQQKSVKSTTKSKSKSDVKSTKKSAKSKVTAEKKKPAKAEVKVEKKKSAKAEVKADKKKSLLSEAKSDKVEKRELKSTKEEKNVKIKRATKMEVASDQVKAKEAKIEKSVKEPKSAKKRKAKTEEDDMEISIEDTVTVRTEDVVGQANNVGVARGSDLPETRTFQKSAMHDDPSTSGAKSTTMAAEIQSGTTIESVKKEAKPRKSPRSETSEKAVKGHGKVETPARKRSKK